MATESRDNLGQEQSAIRDLAIEFNKLVTKFDAALAKLDADAGVTDTDYASTLGSAAADGAQQIGDLDGTAISS